MEVFKKFRHKTENRILEICYDEESRSPRQYSTFGLIFTYREKFTFADIPDEKALVEAKNNGVVLEIYANEYNGNDLSTKQLPNYYKIGYIYATKAEIKKRYRIKRLTDAFKERAKKELDTEIRLLSHYLNGRTFCYVISSFQVCDLGHEHKVVNEVCHDFYGYDFDNNRLWDYVGKKEDWIEI